MYTVSLLRYDLSRDLSCHKVMMSHVRVLILLTSDVVQQIEVILHLLVRLLAFLGVPFLMNLFFFFIHFYLLSGTMSPVHAQINDPQAQLATHPNSTSKIM